MVIVILDTFFFKDIQCSIQWKKALILWQKSDYNSTKVHGLMSSRSRGNAITRVDVNEERIEGVDNTRETSFNEENVLWHASGASVQ